MPAQLKRLILHVGPHKTGTTSLQHHLASHRATLLAQGFAVPPILSLDKTPNNWYLVYVACSDDARLATYHNSVRGQHGPADCARLRQRFSERVEQELLRIRRAGPDAQQAIFSTEEVAFLRPDDWDHLYRLLLAHSKTVEMVYYLRSPIDRLRSDFQQGVKGGSVLSPALFSTLPNQDLLRVQAMEPATELQPRIRLQVRPYRERQDSNNWDVIADFLSVIGAEPPDGSKPPLAHNPSISLELFSVLQDINRMMPAVGPKGDYNLFRHHLHDAIEAYRWTKEDHAFSLSHQDVEQLTERQGEGLQHFLAFCRQADWVDLHKDCESMQPASGGLKPLKIPGSALEHKPELSRAYYVNLICHLWGYLRQADIKSKQQSSTTHQGN